MGRKIIVAIAGILLIFSIGLYTKYRSIQNELLTTKSNEKALLLDNANLGNKNRELQLTTEQLEYFNDSILKKLKEVKRELNIKDKDLKSLQYISSVATKVDTIVMRDTIFKENYRIDTVISNDWYRLKLGLYYPNEVIVNPTFKSEKYIVLSYRKETIDPPKKCWLLRLFQKKHKVVEVNIVEKNPYINNENSKFIEIVK